MASVRILFVEDEGLIRMVVGELLRDEGFEVTEARDGDEAAGLLGGPGCFDVLFTDVQMPGALDGVGVAILARSQQSALPVLVVSGHAPHLIERLRELDPAALFISKPYELEQIVEALRQLTGPPA